MSSKQSIDQDDLNCIALLLESIAEDLRSEGAEEWESLDDCVSATVRNVEHDLNEYMNGEL